MRAKWMITGIALIGMSTAIAQGNRGGENPCKRMEKQSAWIKDSLGLSANQITALKVIDDSTCAEMTRVKSAGGDKETTKGKMHVIMEKRKSAIETLLTNEQKEKLKAHNKQNRMGKGDRMEKDPLKIADKMTKKMNEHLVLTTDQIPKVQEANVDFVTKKMALKSTKESQTNKKEQKVERENLRKGYDAKMKTILSAEQYAKWKELQRQKIEERRKKQQSNESK